MDPAQGEAATAPLSASSENTRLPGPLPNTRRTFVAPGLLLPTAKIFILVRPGDQIPKGNCPQQISDETDNEERREHDQTWTWLNAMKASRPQRRRWSRDAFVAELPSDELERPQFTIVQTLPA